MTTKTVPLTPASRRHARRALTALGALAGALTAFIARPALAQSAYDSANRLTSRTANGKTTTFYYDGENNLVRQCVSSGGPSTCTELVVDTARSLPVVAGEIATGQELVRTWGPQGIAAESSPVIGGVRYPFDDHVGSVRGAATAAGSPLGRRGYGAYGSVRVDTLPVALDAASRAAMGFTGEREAGDGTVFLRSRHYDPSAGRFVERDSFEGFSSRSSSLNRYTYAEANPLSYTDPSGHFILPAIAVAAGAFFIWQAGINPANAPSPRDAPCAIADQNPFPAMLQEAAVQLAFGAALRGALAGSRALAGALPPEIGDFLLRRVRSFLPKIGAKGLRAPVAPTPAPVATPPEPVPATAPPRPRIPSSGSVRLETMVDGERWIFAGKAVPTGDPTHLRLENVLLGRARDVIPYWDSWGMNGLPARPTGSATLRIIKNDLQQQIANEGYTTLTTVTQRETAGLGARPVIERTTQLPPPAAK